jgi:hypothetical protein
LVEVGRRKAQRLIRKGYETGEDCCRTCLLPTRLPQRISEPAPVSGTTGFHQFNEPLEVVRRIVRPGAASG